MSSKTIPLSVRISHQDAEFLAQLNIEGAKTPSDKLRALISDRRKLSIEGQGYSQTMSLIESNLAPAISNLRDVQNSENQHSELIKIVSDWIPAAFAAFVVSGTAVTNIKELKEFENEFADRVFRLLESTLRLGVTSSSPCIDGELITKNINTSVELINIIQDRLVAKGE